MPNPLKGWKLRRKSDVDLGDKKILPLLKAPKPMKGYVVVSLVSMPVESPRTIMPDLTGMMFSWEGSNYECIGQSVITDTKTIQDLDYAHRRDRGHRIYIKLALKPANDYLATVAMLRGRK